MFEGFEIEPLSDCSANVEINLGERAAAKEAIAYQLLGAIEELLELSGAKELKTLFLAKAWEGAPSTKLELSWTGPS